MHLKVADDRVITCDGVVTNVEIMSSTIKDRAVTDTTSDTNPVDKMYLDSPVIRRVPNANLAKEFVKVKTYSDLLVLRQDANDKLVEPARWVLYVSYFHKSPYPDKDKARADQWIVMYSVIDRSNLEKAVFDLIKESLADFHLASFLIDEVQVGSVDSASKLWEGIFTTFIIDSRPIRFEYIACCILTAYTLKCDDAPSYSSRLSTAHKTRMALGGDTTITVDDLFLILEMAHFQSDDKLQKKIYRNTFKILEKNASDTTLTKNVLNEIGKDTIALFNEDKTPVLKVLKVDLTKVKGTKWTVGGHFLSRHARAPRFQRDEARVHQRVELLGVLCLEGPVRVDEVGELHRDPAVAPDVVRLGQVGEADDGALHRRVRHPCVRRDGAVAGGEDEVHALAVGLDEHVDLGDGRAREARERY